MSVELTSTTKQIDANKMKDGQIAVVLVWCNHSSMLGRVVQRCGDALICLGESSSTQRSTFFCSKFDSGKYVVRVLDDGETLTIKDNQ